MTVRGTTAQLQRSLHRIEHYITINSKESAQLKRNCLQKSQQLVTLIGNTFLTSKTANLELTPYLANCIIQVAEQQLALVGLYQEEENFLEQHMTNIIDRQRLAERLKQQQEDIVKATQACKRTRKGCQEAWSQEEGEIQSLSMRTDNERSRGQVDDGLFLKRPKQEEEWVTEDEMVGFKSIAKVKQI